MQNKIQSKLGTIMAYSLKTILHLTLESTQHRKWKFNIFIVFFHRDSIFFFNYPRDSQTDRYFCTSFFWVKATGGRISLNTQEHLQGHLRMWTMSRCVSILYIMGRLKWKSVSQVDFHFKSTFSFLFYNSVSFRNYHAVILKWLYIAAQQK